MKNVVIKKLEISNFRNITNTALFFGNKSIISGRNKVGKTTLFNAIFWCINGKDVNGNECTDVRPHDADGKVLDYVDIKVKLTLDVDGKTVVLEKTQIQEWRNDVFKGNKNVFAINDIPKKEKEYIEYIEENIAPVDKFIFCTCANSFLRKNTKDRRETLLNLVGDITNEDVFAVNEEYRQLESILMDGTIPQLIKRQNDRIKGYRSEKADIPARIDELSLQKVDYDVAALESEKNKLSEDIDKVKAEINNSSSAKDEFRKEDMNLQFEMSVIAQKLNQECTETRNVIKNRIQDAKMRLMESESNLRKADMDKESLERRLKEIEERGEVLNKNWLEESYKLFDLDPYDVNDSDKVCKTCGQPLPKEQIEEIIIKAEERCERDRVAFEEKKRSIIGKINEEAFALRDEKKGIQKKLDAMNNTALLESIDNEKSYIAKQESDLLMLPTTADLLANEDYRRMATRREELQKLINGADDESTHELNRKLDLLKIELNEVSSKLYAVSNNDKVDSRIEELNERLLKISQLEANEEMLLDLIRAFNKSKMELLTEKVNKHFNFIKFRLFELQVNGDYKDTCQILVDGTNYEVSLNHGDRILADIDLLVGFSKMSGLSVPIMVDDCESLNSDRIPNIDGQLLILRVTDDKTIMIHNE